MKKLTDEVALYRLMSVHPTATFTDFKYKGSAGKVSAVCPYHGAFLRRYDLLVQGKFCPSCGEMKKGKWRLIPSDTALANLKRWRPEYDFSQFVYVGATTKSVVVCVSHGPFQSNYNNIKEGHGCPSCKSGKVSARFRKPPEIAIEKMKRAAPQYDFSKFNYRGAKEKSTVVCQSHGEFSSDYGSILRGRGCPACGLASRGLKSRLNSAEAINRMRAAMPALDFSLFVYKTSAAKSIVICPVHGRFLKSYNFILAGVGCKECSSNLKAEQATIPFDTFVKRAKAKHNGLYSYKKETYEGASGKVVATCKTHGDFEVRCFDHTCGQGCPSCKDSCFNPNKRAFLYIYKLVKCGVPYVGYGITSSIRRRHEEHIRRCQKAGVTPTLLHTFRFRLGLFCRKVETEISKEFTAVNLGARGFKKETAEWSAYPALLEKVSKLHSAYGKLSSIF